VILGRLPEQELDAKVTEAVASLTSPRAEQEADFAEDSGAAIVLRQARRSRNSQSS
jgi:hypothetical protein